MSDNPNTNKPSEQPALDVEDWELAFEAFAGNTNAALNMGFNLMVMKGYLSYDPPKIEEVLEGIDHAIEALYPYTQFHHLCNGITGSYALSGKCLRAICSQRTSVNLIFGSKQISEAKSSELSEEQRQLLGYA